MKERSQIDEMRAAIRGDLERSRARLRPSPAVQPRDDDVRDRVQPVAETEAARDRLQPVPETKDAPPPGIFTSLFKRR